MRSVLKIGVLGPVNATRDGVEHPIAGPRQRALLARLAVAGGSPISAQSLIDELWGDRPPRDAPHALQARISRLRASVPVGIELTDGGYRIDGNEVETDAVQFDALCQEGRRLSADHDFEGAAEHLHRAIRLWRGRAFEGVSEFRALQMESIRLEQQRCDALADRIELDLTLGQHQAVLPELQGLVTEKPLIERHWAQLMLALQLNGQPQAALAAFARARAVFSDELGAEPSDELGRLHVAILRNEEPRSFLRLRPVGRPRRAADNRPGAPGRSAPPLDNTVTSNEPAAVEAVLEHHCVLLTGPAGIGKTHLLRSIAARENTRPRTATLLTGSSLVRTVPLGAFTEHGSQYIASELSPAVIVDQFTRNRSTSTLLIDNVDQFDDASLYVVTQLVRNSQLPTILTARSFDDIPVEIRNLYDSGDLTHLRVRELSVDEVDELATKLLGAPLTPATLPKLVEAGSGVPFRLREVITASRHEGRLVETSHGWEATDTLSLTPRLAQLADQRFADLAESTIEAASRIAIGGELPVAVVDDAERRLLTRAGVVTYSRHGWLRLAHPLDAEYLRGRLPEGLWHDLGLEVLGILLDEWTADWPAARRRGRILALELDVPIDSTATLAMAQHALGSYDEPLALRAAQAVIDQLPENSRAHRIAALAAAGLGQTALADQHCQAARHHAVTQSERCDATLAHAQCLGVRSHDAPAALALLRATIAETTDPEQLTHLRRDAARWAVVAGAGSEQIEAPGAPTDAAATLGLVTAIMSGVISGPLEDAAQGMIRLRNTPATLIAAVPGAATLIDLTEAMLLSNTGDVLAAERHLERAISEARSSTPESLGVWEYALGFSKLFSSDTEHAHRLACDSVDHLKWRDVPGLLPAAIALAGATAQATGRVAEADRRFASVPNAAQGDPKVVMLRAWAQAWRARGEGDLERAGRTLLDTSTWLLGTQHTYFSGMLAHCVVRTGQRNQLDESVAILDEAHQRAGGGLLAILRRHGAASRNADLRDLAATAREAEELGMLATATETWTSLARSHRHVRPAPIAREQWMASATRLQAITPAMAMWSATP